MFKTTLRWSSRPGMAAAIIGSSLNTFPQLAMPRLVVSAMLPLRYRWLTTWNRAAAASAGSGEIAHFVNDEQPRPGVEPHRGGPPSFEGGPVAAGREVGRGGVVDPHAGGDPGVAW